MNQNEDWAWEVVMRRVEGMPPDLKLAIAGVGALSRDEMLAHLDKRDEIGKKIVKMQINYLRFLKEEALR
jgi:hypothetical protein